MSAPIKNRIRSGPGPLKTIYEKIASLENEVCGLKSQLRLVKRKLHHLEQTNSVKDSIVNRIKEQPFSITFPPLSSDQIPGPELDDPRISINSEIFEDEEPQSDSDGSDESENAVKPEPCNIQPASWLTKNNVKRTGKHLDPIWNKYDVVTGPNGRKTATCRACGNKVSAEANRLRKHFIRSCIKRKSVLRKRTRSVPMNNIVENENLEATINNQNKNNCPRSDSLSEETSEPPAKLKRTASTSLLQKRNKPFDPVWNHYEVSFGPNGKKNAVCYACGVKVSAEAPRLKHHLAKNCTGIGNLSPPQTKEEEDDNMTQLI